MLAQGTVDFKRALYENCACARVDVASDVRPPLKKPQPEPQALIDALKSVQKSCMRERGACMREGHRVRVWGASEGGVRVLAGCVCVRVTTCKRVAGVGRVCVRVVHVHVCVRGAS